MLKETENEMELEAEFRDLETKLVEKINLVYQENLKEFPGGVVIEIASDKESVVRLYLDSNKRWCGRFYMSGWPIGEKPTLLNLLDNYLFVTDPSHRDCDPAIMKLYIQGNRKELTRELIGNMQRVYDSLRETGVKSS